MTFLDDFEVVSTPSTRATLPPAPLDDFEVVSGPSAMDSLPSLPDLSPLGPPMPTARENAVNYMANVPTRTAAGDPNLDFFQKAFPTADLSGFSSRRAGDLTPEFEEFRANRYAQEFKLSGVPARNATGLQNTLEQSLPGVRLDTLEQAVPEETRKAFDQRFEQEYRWVKLQEQRAQIAMDAIKDLPDTTPPEQLRKASADALRAANLPALETPIPGYNPSNPKGSKPPHGSWWKDIAWDAVSGLAQGGRNLVAGPVGFALGAARQAAGEGTFVAGMSEAFDQGQSLGGQWSGSELSDEELLAPSRRAQEGAIANTIVRMGAEQVPQLGAMAATGMVRGAGPLAELLALGHVGLQEADGARREIYQNALAKNIPDAEARQMAVVGGTVVGALNGFLEKVPFREFISRNPQVRPLLSRVASGFVAEGVTEGAQELTALMAQYGYSLKRPEMEDLQRVMTAALAGGIIGGGMGGVEGAFQQGPPASAAPGAQPPADLAAYADAPPVEAAEGMPVNLPRNPVRVQQIMDRLKANAQQQGPAITRQPQQDQNVPIPSDDEMAAFLSQLQPAPQATVAPAAGVPPVESVNGSQVQGRPQGQMTPTQAGEAALPPPPVPQGAEDVNDGNDYQYTPLFREFIQDVDQQEGSQKLASATDGEELVMVGASGTSWAVTKGTDAAGNAIIASVRVQEEATSPSQKQPSPEGVQGEQAPSVPPPSPRNPDETGDVAGGADVTPPGEVVGERLPGVVDPQGAPAGAEPGDVGEEVALTPVEDMTLRQLRETAQSLGLNPAGTLGQLRERITAKAREMQGTLTQESDELSQRMTAAKQGAANAQEAPAAEPAVAAAAPAAAEAVKEPWQMTKGSIPVNETREGKVVATDVFGNGIVVRKEGGFNILRAGVTHSTVENFTTRTGERGMERARAQLRYITDDSHRAAIKRAIQDGKPVPPEVLADYPDLASPQTPPAPPQPAQDVPQQVENQVQEQVAAPQGESPKEPDPTLTPLQRRAKDRRQQNEPKVAKILESFAAGKPVNLATQLRVTRYSKPEHIKIGKDGGVYVREGSKWVFLFDNQVDSLVRQAEENLRESAPQQGTIKSESEATDGTGTGNNALDGGQGTGGAPPVTQDAGSTSDASPPDGVSPDQGSGAAPANGQPGTGRRSRQGRKRATGGGGGVGATIAPGAQDAAPSSGESGGEGQRGGGGQSESGVREGDAGGPRGDAGGGQAAARKPVTRPDNPSDRNHVIASPDEILVRGEKTKLRANMDALRLLKKLEDENRNATPEEKQVLAKYLGWGQFSEYFNDRNPKDEAVNKELHGLMSDEEFASARHSTVNAHYTDPHVVQAMWGMVQKLGFDGGKVLEPGAGSGLFLGLAPRAVADNARFTAIDIDSLSARLMKKLYPESDVRHQGFQEAKLANNSFDLAIGNVPFANTPAPGAKDYPKHSLHDYFFSRSLDKVKPGGMLAFITSHYSMDKVSQTIRREWAEKADLVGAIRLPNNAFEGNAGTKVTTDILFFRKKDGSAFAGEPFLGLAQVGEATTDGDVTPILVNEYFAKHPKMVMGEHTLEGSMQARGDEYALIAPKGFDLPAKLQEAVSALPENVMGRQAAAEEAAPEDTVDGIRESGHGFKDGKVVQVIEGKPVEPRWMREKMNGNKPEDPIDKLKATGRVNVAKAWIPLRDAVLALREAERRSSATDASLAPLRKALNDAYDAYHKKHGTLNHLRDRESSWFLAEDPDYHLVRAIEDAQEVIDPETGDVTLKISKGPLFTKRLDKPYEPPTRAENPTDAVNVSMNETNRVDLPRVAALLGTTEEDAKRKILESGRAFEDPQTGLLEPRERYLSGNVREKLRAAEAAAADDDAYRANMEALKAVKPKDVPISQIEYRLGSRWMPTAALEGFLADKFDVDATITYVHGANTFALNAKNKKTGKSLANGVATFNAVDLFEHALNGTYPKITMPDPTDPGKRVTDVVRTLEAQNRIDRMREEFSDWSRRATDEVDDGEGGKITIRDLIAKTYNETNNGVVPPEYNGDYLTLPGLSPEITLRPHQKTAVARVLQEGAAVLAHGVGSGKTYELIAAAMEGKRIGVHRKPMIVVHNATIGQFATSFMKAYPRARILVADEGSMGKKDRVRFLARIATGDWDAIIMKQSQFERLSDSADAVNRYFQEQLDELEDAIYASKEREGKKSPTVKELEKARDRLLAKLKAKLDKIAGRSDKELSFDQLGIDALFVDEAHNYKNLPIVTRMKNVKGIPTTESERSIGLQIKAANVQGRRGGKGVVLATGTPITNTMAEAYVMLKMATPNVLAEYNIRNFDDFAHTFGQSGTDTTFSWSQKWKVETRFNRWQNLPELISLLRTGFDVKMGNKELGLKVPDVRGGGPTLVGIDQTPETERITGWLMDIADKYEALQPGDRRENSWVAIASMQAGLAASVDPRLVDERAKDLPESKVNQVVRKVADIWKAGEADKTTQLILSDHIGRMDVSKLRKFMEDPSRTEEDVDADTAEKDVDEDAAAQEADTKEYEQAKRGWNLYADMKAKLVKLGIPADQIAIIHEYPTDDSRQKLFAKVNAGEVRVVIGSHEKMGVGVNMQKRLAALHRLGPPKRMTPAMMEQGDGRIIRQGNDHAERGEPVDIFNYGLKKSMDIGIYQKLEQKQKMLVAALTGKLEGRTMDELQDSNAQMFADMKAMLTDNPLAIRKVELEQQLAKLTMERRSHDQGVYDREQKLRSLRLWKENVEERLATYDKARPVVEPVRGIEGDGWRVFADGTEHTGHKEAVAALEEAVKKARTGDSVGVEINGIPVQIQYVERGGLRFSVYNPEDINVRSKWGMYFYDSARLMANREFSSAGGLLTAVRNLPSTVETETRHANEDLRKAESGIQAFETMGDQKWAKEEEYAAKVDELRKVNNWLSHNLKAAPADGKMIGEDDTPEKKAARAFMMELKNTEEIEYARLQQILTNLDIPTEEGRKAITYLRKEGFADVSGNRLVKGDKFDDYIKDQAEPEGAKTGKRGFLSDPGIQAAWRDLKEHFVKTYWRPDLTEQHPMFSGVPLDPELERKLVRLGVAVVKAGFRTFKAFVGQISQNATGNLRTWMLTHARDIYAKVRDENPDLAPDMTPAGEMPARTFDVFRMANNTQNTLNVSENTRNVSAPTTVSQPVTPSEPQESLFEADTADADSPAEPPLLPPRTLRYGPNPAPLENTSARKADMAEDRAALGLDTLNSPERKAWETTLQKAKDRGIPDRAVRLAGEVVAAPRAFTDEETAGLVVKAAALKSEHKRLLDELSVADDPADIRILSAEAGRVEEEFDLLSRALRMSGTEKGRALAAQKLTIDKDFSLVSTLSRAKAAKGANLTEAERAKFEELTIQLEAAGKRVEDLEKRIAEQQANGVIKVSKARNRIAPQTREKTKVELYNRLKELLAQGCANN